MKDITKKKIPEPHIISLFLIFANTPIITRNNPIMNDNIVANTYLERDLLLFEISI